MNILIYIILLIVDAIIILLSEKYCKKQQKNQFDYGYYAGIIVSAITYITLKYI